MLGHLRPKRRKIHLLASLVAHQNFLPKRLPASAAALHGVNDHVVRILRQPQRRPFVSLLPSRLPPRPLTGLHNLPAHPVAGRGLAAVVAIGVKLPFQFRHSCFQALDLRTQTRDEILLVLDERDNRIQPRTVGGDDVIPGDPPGLVLSIPSHDKNHSEDVDKCLDVSF